MPPADAQISDQRLLKGARARATIARHAAEVASAEGLTGLSLRRLAADLGVSKSGVATLFGTKEKLQLAAVESAREVFIQHVIVPALSVDKGMPRLRALLDNWFALLEKEIRRAQDQGFLTGRDPHALAFQFDAVVAAANTAARMGEDSAIATARGIIDALIGADA
ncbi:TetR/AcrR family transcriptional regulator [Nocardia crassostreae]|uniref:TetR/AcrR family transcriptional regulator n=1 Tax=Nocardia crassostreae TaxID=53428 RepID=UPI00082DA156|nr:TetR family transcriptional regulator [Nocardia crassostreae]